ncbi:MAG: hypothetical protein K9N21_21715 [Deltaproteobacteria bacterium]|nr:hypothetical protein [Deltaproteobacteria bacterium]
MKQTLIKISLFFIGVALTCPGCKTLSLPTGRGYTQLVQEYVGHEADRLVNEWGYPGRTFDAPDQGKVYVYVETRDEYTLNPLAHSALIEYPPRVDPRSGRTGESAGKVTGQTVSSMNYCITYFEVNKDNQIVGVFWKGDCKALERADGQPDEGVPGSEGGGR